MAVQVRVAGIERLNAGLHRKLTLISFPAGFGKATLKTTTIQPASCPIRDALTFLLEHLPLQMHLMIATREDLPLPHSIFKYLCLKPQNRVQ